MSGDERWRGGGPGDGTDRSDDTGRANGTGADPVEEFFAAHRAQVRDEQPDDLTWHRIREGGRRGRSSRRGAWGAGLVAAVGGLIAWATIRGGGSKHPPRHPSTSQACTTYEEDLPPGPERSEVPAG